MAQGLFTLRQVNQAIRQSGWSGTQKTPAVEYLVVAGGGAGGDNPDTANGNGGGGAGGLRTGYVGVTTGSSITVTIGAGSGRFGTSGDNSVFGSITANGGGTGGRQGIQNGFSGGSGGGGSSSSSYLSGGAGISGQGNSGGFGVITEGGGGGGGAGTVGLNALSNIGGNGGAGIASAINGTVTTYAGGGGGGVKSGGTAGAGGVGGGGAGNGTNGTANTGGGGGSGPSYGNAGTGGSGIVILSYPDVYAAPTSTTGSPTVSTSGSGSISTNGSSQYITYGGQSAFAFGTGDFTIEGWYYFNDVTTVQLLYDFRATSVNGSNPVVYIASGLINYYPAGTTAITGTTTISTGSWYHVALCRSGTVTKLFVNGVLQGSPYTDTTNYAVGANRPMLGASGFSNAASGFLNGYQSNIRILKGTALYTATFTPPTAPLSAITNTSLLLNAISGAYLTDGSTNSFVATTSTTVPTWNSSSPFATGLGYKNRVYTWTSSGSITF